MLLRLSGLLPAPPPPLLHLILLKINMDSKVAGHLDHEEEEQQGDDVVAEVEIVVGFLVLSLQFFVVVVKRVVLCPHLFLVVVLSELLKFRIL